MNIPHLSSDQLTQVQGALFTLHHILQNGQLAITHERIKNSRLMTLHDFL